MSTRSRIQRLERELRQSVSGNDHEVAMAHLVGTIDGLFWPDAIRLDQLHVMPTVKNQRELYLKTGIAWAGLPVGKDAAGWKSNQRLRESLENAGLVSLSRTGSKPLIKPTEAAMRDMRQRLGLYQSDSIAVLAIKIRTAIALVAAGSLRGEPDSHPWAPGELGWCHETWLFDCEYSEQPTRDDWAFHAGLALPLLVDGVLETRQTTIRHVCYRFNPRVEPDVSVEPLTEGHVEKFLDGIEELAKATEERPKLEASEDVQDVYFNAFHDQLARNESHKRTDEIWIPLPATSIGVLTGSVKSNSGD